MAADAGSAGADSHYADIIGRRRVTFLLAGGFLAGAAIDNRATQSGDFQWPLAGDFWYFCGRAAHRAGGHGAAAATDRLVPYCRARSLRRTDVDGDGAGGAGGAISLLVDERPIFRAAAGARMYFARVAWMTPSPPRGLQNAPRP